MVLVIAPILAIVVILTIRLWFKHPKALTTKDKAHRLDEIRAHAKGLYTPRQLAELEKELDIGTEGRTAQTAEIIRGIDKQLAEAGVLEAQIACAEERIKLAAAIPPPIVGESNLPRSHTAAGERCAVRDRQLTARWDPYSDTIQPMDATDPMRVVVPQYARDIDTHTRERFMDECANLQQFGQTSQGDTDLSRFTRDERRILRGHYTMLRMPVPEEFTVEDRAFLDALCDPAVRD